ncbi:hypothetical protein HTZ84_10935 [Haloterrigena sp. SYSU A558-1]|uniref:Uncharacterized protein n=1 Tax=Haloterrigena gelatinilytica TaxID=2741724 RepID=A0ABX2L9A4_9EURY|nr:hypothetical protein [Haloterrigena gelatinilytica]NUC72817.1 hypothetical protein [Haloterrigena gelatinilytica]
MVVLTTFAVSLLTGGLGIYLGARYVVGSRDYVNAAITGLLGAVVLVVVGALFGWVPLLGQVLLFVVYVAVIGRRYPGDWVDAASIAAIAWATVAVVLTVLAAAGVATIEVFGVPALDDLVPVVTRSF